MKKIILFLTTSALIVLLLTALNSCNKEFQKATAARFVQNVVKYTQEHCPASTSYYNPETGQTILKAKCSNLWLTTDIQSICKEAVISIDVANAEVSVALDCISPVKIPNLSKVITAFPK